MRVSFIKDFFTTTGTSIISMVALVLTTRLLAGYLSPDEFGAYSLVRRMLASVLPVACLGASSALPYFVARASNEGTRKQYLVASAVMVSLILSIFLVLGIGFRKPLSTILFQSSKYELLVVALCIIVAGYALHTTLYSYYRGALRIQRANILEISFVAIGPLLIVLTIGRLQRADMIVLAMGILAATTLFPLVVLSLKMGTRLSWPEFRKRCTELLSYGVPRIPGSFYLAALMAYGPFLVSRTSSLEEAGYLSASLSILSILQTPVLAFGTVILPIMSRVSSAGNRKLVSKVTEMVIEMTFQVGTYVTCCCLVWTREIVALILGPGYGNTIPLMRVVLLATVPYLLYVLLRSVIDAVETRSINTNSLLVSLCVALICSWIGAIVQGGAIGITIGVVCGMFTLGGLTLQYLFRNYEISLGTLFVRQILIINGILLIAQVMLRESMYDRVDDGTIHSILTVLVIAIISLFYGFTLLRVKSQWTVELLQRIQNTRYLNLFAS